MRKNSTLPLLTALTIANLCLGQVQVSQAQSACKLADGKAIAGAMDSQECPGLGRRSLTVVGQGQVSAPADTALLEFRFGSRESSSASEPDSSGLSIQDARKVTEAALQPTVKALTAAGVPARNITIQTGSIQNPKMLVKVDKPTQERLQQVVLTVDQSLKSSQQSFLQSISAGYSVDRCEPLERSARRIALQDAQRQMVTLAQDVKVELGELLAVTVLPLVGSSAAIGCGTKVGIPASPLSFATDETIPPYNPSDQPEVQIRSQVSVTHAIKSDIK